ncbi:flagellar brake protein [Paenibacillus sp. MBLB4367]|uniref:flagellar brake protein n=1 Tax=Paenibacillus sp. MBLB4367 TaxID=3384767 RepID=UPI0039080F8D
MVEKQDYVSTGVLAVVEGDMVEIEIGDYKQFELGDAVKLTIYSPEGIFMFQSTIIAKDNGSLIVINPPENQRKFSEKREHFRVDVKMKGSILSIESANDSRSPEATDAIPLTVVNISVSGIGFTVGSECRLTERTIVRLELEMGTIVSCTAEIVRRETSELGCYYGAQFVDFPQERLNALRAFILKTQVELSSVRRQEEKEARIFK